MITKARILDPNARNRHLRAYAFLRSRLRTSGAHAIDCLIPFLIIAVAEHEGAAFDEHAISAYVAQNFGPELPLYLVNEARGKLIELGALQSHRQTGIDVCCDKTDEIDFVAEDARLNDANFDLVVDKLQEFADAKGRAGPLASADWESALINFFQRDVKESPSQPQSFREVMLSDPQSIDDRIIAEFVLNCSEGDPALYETIEMIFFGVLAADFISSLWSTGKIEHFKDLIVFYDTTLLMRMLGTSGKLLKNASIELHEMLVHLGCETLYFEHVYDELQRNLDAIVNAHDARSRMHKETQDAIRIGEVSVADIRELRATADTILGELGITQSDYYYSRVANSTLYQINEHGLVANLSRGRFANASDPFPNDGKSISLVFHIRAGKKTRDVSDCKAIMVTTNPFLAQRSRRFLIADSTLTEHDVGPVITAGQLATIAWLVDEPEGEPAVLSREFIANCHRAAMPGAGWDDEFWRAINAAEPEESKKLEDMVLVHTARAIALEESYGNSALIRTLNVAEIIQRAEREAAEREKLAAANAETKARRTVQEEQYSKLSTISRSLATWTTRILLFVIALIALLLLVFSSPEELAGNSLLLLLKYGFEVTLLVGSILGLFGLSFLGRFRRQFEEWLCDLYLRALVRAFS